MKHVVTNKKVTCAKCLKEHMGATVSVFDFFSCPDCFYGKYEVELQPKIMEMVREYFKPS